MAAGVNAAYQLANGRVLRFIIGVLTGSGATTKIKRTDHALALDMFHELVEAVKRICRLPPMTNVEAYPERDQRVFNITSL